MAAIMVGQVNLDNLGMSHRKMAAELNARKIPTPAGGQWHAVTVKRVLSRLG
jgi:hypothetical protein